MRVCACVYVAEENRRVLRLCEVQDGSPCVTVCGLGLAPACLAPLLLAPNLFIPFASIPAYHPAGILSYHANSCSP